MHYAHLPLRSTRVWTVIRTYYGCSTLRFEGSHTFFYPLPLKGHVKVTRSFHTYTHRLHYTLLLVSLHMHFKAYICHKYRIIGNFYKKGHRIINFMTGAPLNFSTVITEPYVLLLKQIQRKVFYLYVNMKINDTQNGS